uniref:Uncharacterized protein n=1 Tax=Ovis aries TaxID=9940 RepID=A0AC11CTI3_SHEEP
LRLIIFFAAKDGEALYSQQKQNWELTGSDHELLIAKFRLKLKKVGKTTRPFRFHISGGILGSKITADGDCSHEIKRHLLLGRKAMTNLDSILKSRDITLLTKVHLVKDMVFPIVMYGCESWTIKQAEC